MGRNFLNFNVENLQNRRSEGPQLRSGGSKIEACGLGASWGLLGALGVSWGVLGSQKGLGEAQGGPRAASWGCLEAVLGPSWACLGSQEAVFGASWDHLGSI